MGSVQKHNKNMKDYIFIIWAAQYNSLYTWVQIFSEKFETSAGNSSYSIEYHHHATVKAIDKQKHA